MYKESFNFLNINDRLKTMFFLKKEVKIQQCVFDLYYDDIFPCPKYFIEFLSCDSYEQQLICAKRIINRMFFLNYNSVCFNLFKNLINMEQSEILNNDETYKPRNHSIHSVNTYLLGIYLYFSMETFNNQLNIYFDQINSTTNSRESRFNRFLESWKIFSLNHDIGYPMERLVGKDNKYKSVTSFDVVSSIDDLSKLIANELSVLQILCFVFVRIIQKESTIKLSKRMGVFSHKYKSQYNELCKKINLSDFVRLDRIYSYETLELFDVFELDQICFLIIENNQPVCFVLNDGDNVFFDKKDKYCIDDTRKCKLKSFSVEYYYPTNKIDILLTNIMNNNSHYSNDIIYFTDEVINNYSIEYAEISNHQKYIDYVYVVYCFFKKHIIDTSVSVDLNLDYYKDKYFDLIRYLLEDISAYLKDNCDFDTSKTVKDSLSEKVSTFLDMYYKEKRINKVFDKYFLKSSAESHELKYIYSSLFAEFEKIIVPRKSLFWKINKTSARLLTEKEKNNDFKLEFEKIKNSFVKIAIESGILQNIDDFEYMIKYKDDYNLFDHGIASTYISIEVFYKNKIAIEALERKLFPKNFFGDKESLIQALFSIFVHNMYVSYYKKNSSINIQHNILKNPFVYFAMFCDNMQVWDRPFDVNHGKIDISKLSITHQEFSAEVIENRIYIRCKSADIESILKRYRDSLDEYLKDASKLIILGVSE